MTWGLVAVAGASLVGGAISANGAKRAANAQQRGADAATAETARQYDRTRADLAPYRTTGTGALNQLARVFGLPSTTTDQAQWDDGELIQSQGGVPSMDAQRYASDPAYRYAWDKTLETEKATRPGWNGQATYSMNATNADWTRLNESMGRNLADYRAQNPTPEAQSSGSDMSGFFTSPGYQFRRDEGMRGIERTAAARGGAFSGNALRALTDFNSNIASDEFGNYVNQLGTIAGIGQSSTNQTAAYGADAANSASRNALFAGDARASGITGQANAIGNSLQDAAGLYGYYKNNRVPPGYGGTGYGGYGGYRGIPWMTPGYGDGVRNS